MLQKVKGATKSVVRKLFSFAVSNEVQTTSWCYLCENFENKHKRSAEWEKCRALQAAAAAAARVANRA